MKCLLSVAAATAVFAAPALAQSGVAHSDHATPHEAVTLAQWSDRVQREFERTLVYPHQMMGDSVRRGVVRVKFNCSESGRPDKVTLMKTSGSRAFDQAAIRAVQKIVTLHPLPDGLGQDQAYQAVLLFDSVADGDHWKRMKEIAAEAKSRNAWFKGPPKVLETASR